MNFTIAALQLASLSSSPFLSHPSYKTKSFNYISRCKVDRLAKTFYSSLNNYAALKFERSSFTRLLDSAITISEVDMSFVNTKEHQHAYGSTGSSVQVIGCAFLNCTALDGHGGGIYFDQKCLYVGISRSVFIGCAAKKNGGAFSATVTEIIVERSYIQECTAMSSGHAMNIYHSSPASRSIVTDTTIDSCATKKKILGMTAVNDMFGHCHYRMINATNCVSGVMASAISFIIHENVSLAFAHFKNCFGPTLIKSYEVRQQTMIGWCNFIDTESSETMFRVEGQNLFIRCVFSNNKFPVFGKMTQGKKDAVKITMIDCTTDFKTDTKDKRMFPRGFTSSKMFYVDKPEELPLQFAHSGGPTIVPAEKIGEAEMYMENLVPPQYRQTYSKYFMNTYDPIMPRPTATQRGMFGAPPVPAERPAEHPVISQDPTATRPKKIVITEEPTPVATETPTIAATPSPSRSKKRVLVFPPRSTKMKHPKNLPSATPTATDPPTMSNTFTDSATLFRSATFTASHYFTASPLPTVSMVPYVLYSAAAFIVIAVLASFYFMNTSPTDYNMMMSESGSYDSSTGSGELESDAKQTA